MNHTEITPKSSLVIGKASALFFRVFCFAFIGFSLSACIQFGCLDPEASNFDPNANTDDESCSYDEFPVGELISPIGEIEYTGDQFFISVVITDDRGLRSGNVFVKSPYGNRVDGNGSFLGTAPFRLEESLVFEVDMLDVVSADLGHLGEYTVEYQLIDSDNNRGDSEQTFILTDKTGPEIQLTQFRVREYSSVYSVDGFISTKDFSGVASLTIEFWTVSSNGVLINQLARDDFDYKSSLNPQYGSVNFIVPSLKMGDFYQLIIKAQDQVGNEEIYMTDVGQAE